MEEGRAGMNSSRERLITEVTEGAVEQMIEIDGLASINERRAARRESLKTGIFVLAYIVIFSGLIFIIIIYGKSALKVLDTHIRMKNDIFAGLEQV